MAESPSSGTVADDVYRLDVDVLPEGGVRLCVDLKCDVCGRAETIAVSPAVFYPKRMKDWATYCPDCSKLAIEAVD